MFPLRAAPKPDIKHKKLVEIHCPCGKTILVIPSVARKGKKYCSGECYLKNFQDITKFESRDKKIIKQLICDCCGIQFERAMYSHTIMKKVYCSTDCQRKSKRVPVKRKCKNCNKDYTSNPSRNSKFCNLECMKEWNKKNPRFDILKKSPSNSGENNKMYKHGKYVGKGRPGGASAKKKIKELLNEIEGNWCIVCGIPGPGLHLHRVVYGSQGGKYELDNCVQLCMKHHEEVHTSKIKWLPILQAHTEKRKSLRDDWRKVND